MSILKTALPIRLRRKYRVAASVKKSKAPDGKNTPALRDPRKRGFPKPGRKQGSYWPKEMKGRK